MPTGSYDRYGLTGNPFRELASENVEDVGIFHVNQAVDATLRTIREEVFDKENRAFVAVTGPLGAGKTERLLLTAAEGREHGAFVVYFDLTVRTEWVMRGLAAEIRKTAEAAKIAKTFGGPSWLRVIAAAEKAKDASYDPKEAGRTLATILNDRAPSMLLLNDLHNLAQKAEVDSFVEVLQETVDQIRPGVLVMFSAYSSYVVWLATNHAAFATRINRTFPLTGLSDDEAGLLLAKKMLAKRIVEDLPPTFPFDREAVQALNKAAAGNPRRLLEFADLALEHGVAHRAYQVDAEIVAAALREHVRTAAAAPAVQERVPVETPSVPPVAAHPVGTPGAVSGKASKKDAR